ncbi:MAG: hypothetical protein A2V70_09715 [Planctomycetes bacterium RBG_13_63_9]|nr:MAG: hypothetical protein A2V70_09715 [Planctomycetes bacterium RBG_13_63_9]
MTNCADTLIEHGRDQYGPIRSDILMSIIDVDTLKWPPKPVWLDSAMYYEGRAHRRAMRGSNSWWIQLPNARGKRLRHESPIALSALFRTVLAQIVAPTQDLDQDLTAALVVTVFGQLDRFET